MFLRHLHVEMIGSSVATGWASLEMGVDQVAVGNDAMTTRSDTTTARMKIMT